MNIYRITYDYGDSACLFRCKAESEGDALEQFERFADGLSDYAEILSIKELPQ